MSRKRKSAGSAMFAVAAVIMALLLFGIEIHFPTHSGASNYWTENTNAKSTQNNSAPKIDVAQLNQAFVELADKFSPAVVNIYTKTRFKVPRYYGMPEEMMPFFFGNPFGGGGRMAMPVEREAQALGSGFVINGQGHIVTNSHVVRQSGKNADEIMVKFLKDGREKGYPAEVIGVDERTDVALLKLKEKPEHLTIASLGDSDKAKVGEWVIAIGNPYGHANTVTQGIVSAVGRSLEDLSTEFIQTSASINPGNSGGPLFNLYGEVIGINTAIDPRAQGIGFAIPINNAKKVVQELIENGRVKRGYLGVMVSSLTPETAEAIGLNITEGVIVRDVIPNGPAAKAGLTRGDIITKVGTEEIHDHTKLLQTVAKLKIGDKVPVEVQRKGKAKTFNVTIQEEKQTEQPETLQSSTPGFFDDEG